MLLVSLLSATGALADAKGWGRHGGDRMERMQGMGDGAMQPRFDFAAADADGDGKVTAEELAALRDEADYLKDSLDAVNRRIDELQQKPVDES